MGGPVPAVLECKSLSKSYGPVRALVDVSLSLRAGEVRALLGKNGAGKSTLVNIISGAQRPDAGTLKVAGQEVHWNGPGEARTGGIAVVHQELSLVPGLTVAENIMLGRWPRTKRAGGVIDTKALEATAAEAVQALGEPLPLWREAGQLPLAQQQIVEIAKALVDEPRVLILDEPTSALHSREVDALIALVRRLAARGVAIIYVSHRMSEIPRVADTLTVLRDGREVNTIDADAASADEVAAMIAGEAGTLEEQLVQHHTGRRGDVVLSVRDLQVPDVLRGVSFDLHAGEVLGIAGLLGAGRTELLEAIYGTRQAQGQIAANGKRVRRPSPRRMLARGVGLTPEDRKNAGIFPLLGVGENILLSARGRVLPRVWVKPSRELPIVSQIVKRLEIVASSADQELGTLSGGNQQKAVIGRMLAAKMSVLLLDEPTRGIDVHAKAQIYQQIRELAAAGVSSIFVSSELDEIAAVCDRVLILRQGRVTEEVPGSTTADRLLALAMKEQD